MKLPYLTQLRRIVHWPPPPYMGVMLAYVAVLVGAAWTVTTKLDRLEI